MKIKLLIFLLFFRGSLISYSQACTPAGDETTYGTGNVWNGYVYDNINFTSYSGYVTEGNAGSPDFDENFTGDYVNYTTNGCPVYTETFSVRYKLIKTFADGDYEFTVGADDGFRLSLDGGTTWIINNWNDQSYTINTATVHLNGSYNMVLEYYENGGGNRVSFSVAPTCLGIEDQSVYGTGNVWRGYVYDGTSFNTYKGLVTEGISTNPNFDESFGGSNTIYSTSNCSTQTETFSIRYRLRKYLNGSYIFILGGDDGYRLSLDGGATWVINRWADQSYNTFSYAATLSGTYDMVVEYYENGGDNRISFSLSGAVLPVTLISFDAQKDKNKALLEWETTTNSTTDHFEIEKNNSNNNQFQNIGIVSATEGIMSNNSVKYTFTDNNLSGNTSYYRLKMYDLSGTISYSKILSVQSSEASNRIEIYPTISRGAFYIKSSERITNPKISLFDMNGKLVAEKKPGTLNIGTAIPLIFSNIITKGIFVMKIYKDEYPILTQKVIINQ
jgi:hypothetical protein